MRALDDPALGLNDEAPGNDLWPQRLLLGLPGAGGAIARMAHDVHSDAVGLLDGLGASTAVSGIGVQRLQARDPGAGLGDDGGGRVAVLHAGGGDGDRQQQAKRVDHEVALAPLDRLAGVKAGVAALGRAAGTLSIDDGSGGVRCAADAIAPPLAKPIVHALESAAPRPAAEDFVYGTPGRFNGAEAIGLGKHADIRQRVVDLDASMGPRPSASENGTRVAGSNSAAVKLQWGRGHRPRKTQMCVPTAAGLPVASMGPRPSASENSTAADAPRGHGRASMGPRPSASENSDTAAM